MDVVFFRVVAVASAGPHHVRGRQRSDVLLQRADCRAVVAAVAAGRLRLAAGAHVLFGIRQHHAAGGSGPSANGNDGVAARLHRIHRIASDDAAQHNAVDAAGRVEHS